MSKRTKPKTRVKRLHKRPQKKAKTARTQVKSLKRRIVSRNISRKHVANKKLRKPLHLATKKPIVKAAKATLVSVTVNPIQTQKKEAKQSKKALKAIEATAVKNAMTTKSIEETAVDPAFVAYANKVDVRTMDIIKMLAVPQTDDVLAEKAAMKINDVRRILNMLNGEGIARYNVHKNSKGWLTFKWYIDVDKLTVFRSSLYTTLVSDTGSAENTCNDFFVCEACYKKNSVILPFEAIFEAEFKCTECGKPLKRIAKDEAFTIA